MGIKDFFRKVGSGIKNGLKAGYNWVKDKALPVVGRIADTGMNILSLLPGKLRMIGKVGSFIGSGIKAITGQIGNKDLSKKIDDGVDRLQGKLDDTIHTGQDWARKGYDIGG